MSHIIASTNAMKRGPIIKKIIVIGGGPGGLYFALLTKKARPDWHIEVHEQNRADDTFGFGVVFSDDTLDEFLSRDPESYSEIVRSFAYWDDIDIRFKGQSVRCGGNGFAGCSRLALLQVLQNRCQALGVVTFYESFVDASELQSRFRDADLIVASDGINSNIREYFANEFKPSVKIHRNKFTWMGSTRQLDAFTYFFKGTEHGSIVAHTYQYELGMSTWVFEMSTPCWQAHGFDGDSEAESASKLEQIFKEELGGHPLITNRSVWRNFPRIFCENWTYGNIAILGDAKATAHFSIGSGTKLAMECAIALSDATVANIDRGIQAVFEEYDNQRRTPVQITQHNADTSLDWFEHFERSWDMTPIQFAMVVMSRAKSITWDNLALRDPEFVEAVEDDFYQTLHEQTGIDCRESRPTPMFTPIRLRGMTLANRVVVSPMAQYSAVDGVPTDWHFVHYGARALGGAGLVYTEMTCPTPDARITTGCTGLWSGEQEAAWKRIVAFVHGNSEAKICLQLGHAGRKGSTQLGWQRMDYPIDGDNWPVYSASPLPYMDGISQTPVELGCDQMKAIEVSFVDATIRARNADFDMVELHCAHGYLFAGFLSPLTNQRTDEFGGGLKNRMRFPLSVFSAMRREWPDDKPMAIRISATDWKANGITEDDTIGIAHAFAEAGCDLVDVSAGQTVHDQNPVYGRMFQTPFAEAIKNVAGISTMAVGNITEAAQINTIIACRRADLVALARPHLWNPSFTHQAAGWYGAEEQEWPPQYLSGRDQAMRLQQAAREKQLELQHDAKPQSHAPQATDAKNCEHVRMKLRAAG